MIPREQRHLPTCVGLFWFVVYSGAGFAGAYVRAQQPARPIDRGGCVVGRVIDGSTSKGIEEALVIASSGGRVVDSVAAGPDGLFLVRVPERARVSVRVTASGFGETQRPSAVEQQSSVLIDTGGGGCVRAAPVVLWPTATVGGTVTGPRGPVIAGPVKLIEVRMTAGVPALDVAATVTTNDRGEFLFIDVTPGRYLVAYLPVYATTPLEVARELATGGTNVPWFGEFSLLGEMSTVSSGLNIGDSLLGLGRGNAVRRLGEELAVTQAAFYPSQELASLGSDSFPLLSGESLTGVQLVAGETRPAVVEGNVHDEAGPLAYAPVFLYSSGVVPKTKDFQVAVGFTDRGGDFSLLGVPPGQYHLEVLRVPRPASGERKAGLHAQVMVVAAEGGRTSVDALARPTSAINGTVEFPSDAAALSAPPKSNLRIEVVPVGGNMIRPADTRCRVDSVGTFQCGNLPPGRYALNVEADAPWFPTEIRGEHAVGDDWIVEVTDQPAPVRVLLSDRPTGIRGVVASPTPVTGDSVYWLVFPACVECWSKGLEGRRLFQTGRAGTAGTFVAGGLPAGDYMVAAVTMPPPPEWQHPDYLNRLMGHAVAAEVRHGALTSVTPRVAGLVAK